MRLETRNNIFTKKDTDVKPGILVIVDKEKYKKEMLDFIKLHKLNIKFENENIPNIVVVP